MRVELGSQVFWDVVDGKTIVSTTQGPGLFSLTGTAELLWQWIDTGATLKQLAARLGAQYPQHSPDIIAEDVNDFVSDLLNRGLVTVSED